MEEKKLTDEEVIKELINESNRGEWCGLTFIDCVEVRVLKNAIDLIHRLQGEKKELKSIAEYQQGSNMERWRIIQEKDKTIAEQKAEIEWLTKEKLSAVCDLNMRIVELDNELEQAVKDTAKGIYTQVLEWVPVGEDYSVFIHNIEQWLKEKYGVEVE